MKEYFVSDKATFGHPCETVGCKPDNKARFEVSIGVARIFLCPNCYLKAGTDILRSFGKWFRESH